MRKTVTKRIPSEGTTGKRMPTAQPETRAALAQQVNAILEREGLVQPQLSVEPALVRVEPVSRHDVRRSAVALVPSLTLSELSEYDYDSRDDEKHLRYISR
jgi:hypothetical protein